MRSFPLFLSAALLLCLTPSCSRGGIDVKIPQDVIMQRVSKNFPVKKDKGLYSVEISNPKVTLNGKTGRIDVEADTTTRVFGLVPVRGRVLADCAAEYRAGTGSIHVTDIKVKDYQPGDGNADGKKDEVTGLLAGIVADSLSGLEIYRFNEKDLVEGAAKRGLKSIRITDQAVIATLGL